MEQVEIIEGDAKIYANVFVWIGDTLPKWGSKYLARNGLTGRLKISLSMEGTSLDEVATIWSDKWELSFTVKKPGRKTRLQMYLANEI